MNVVYYGSRVVAMAVALVMCGPSALSQRDAAPKLEPRDTIVEQGISKFIAWYEHANKDDSEAAIDNACYYYAKARRAVNAQSYRFLSRAQLRQIGAARHALTVAAEAACAVEEDIAGGGTLYGHLLNRSGAGIEDAVGAVIHQMIRHRSASADSRRTADRAYKQLNSAVLSVRSQVERGPGVDFGPPKHQREADYAALKVAIQRARTVQASLPDRSALLFTQELKSVADPRIAVEGD